MENLISLFSKINVYVGRVLVIKREPDMTMYGIGTNKYWSPVLVLANSTEEPITPGLLGNKDCSIERKGELQQVLDSGMRKNLLISCSIVDDNFIIPCPIYSNMHAVGTLYEITVDRETFKIQNLDNLRDWLLELPIAFSNEVFLNAKNEEHQRSVAINKSTPMKILEIILKNNIIVEDGVEILKVPKEEFDFAISEMVRILKL